MSMKRMLVLVTKSRDFPAITGDINTTVDVEGANTAENEATIAASVDQQML